MQHGRWFVAACAAGWLLATGAQAQDDERAGDLPHQTVEVTSTGLSATVLTLDSAQAIQVIETERAQRESADLGEVLARSQGIGMRRNGGLGSTSQFSLNGFSGDQIRFFMDGLPLELSGYPFGIANVPVNLVQRVEVYRGVVPIQFGADALGGAVNLVSERAPSGSHGAASYQLGSFETHRATLRASHADEASGLFVDGSGFFDRTANNYLVDVEIPDQRGRLTPARVRRFHDAYQAGSGNVAVGVTGRPWAEQLVLHTFLTKYQKELQNNLTMEQVYGDARYGERVAGANLRFENAYGRRVSLDALAGYTRTWRKFIDTGECAYSWYGECVEPRGAPGEIEGIANDQHWNDHATFARISAAYHFTPEHELRLSVSPSYSSRKGEERRGLMVDARDPLSAQRNLLTLVNGLEYTVHFLDDRLEGVLFVKDYLQLQDAEEVLPGGRFVPRSRSTHRNGLGSALKYTFESELTLKLSYEWATRLPRPDELFGDGVRTSANLDLVPERSHNLNLGIALADAPTPFGTWRFDANGFMRAAEQLIEPLRVNTQQIAYQNVTNARSLGIETAVGWTSPGGYLALDGNVTYQDFRNTSATGVQAPFKGDRIPNTPYLFGSGTARGQLQALAFEGDELSLAWTTRYVREFYRSWESAGLGGVAKDFTPKQLTHSTALTYLLRGALTVTSFTVEVQNLTDARVFDLYGIQRPGRAAFCKVTAEL